MVDALDSVDELETDLDQSKESMYKLSYVIRVSAPDLDELKRRCDEVKDFYDDLNVKLVRPAGDMLGLHSEFLPANKRYINDYVQYVKSDFLAGLDAIEELKKSHPAVPALIVEGHSSDNKFSKNPPILEYLPNGKLKIIEDCGHMMNMERPEEFNAALEEFLINIEQ